MEATSDELKVSLIIPVFNSFKYAQSIIDSISANQNCIEEVIFVNDGGDVYDFNLLIDTVKSYHINTKAVSYAENAGPWKARNMGVSHASSEIIAFHDSDDVLPENSISSRVRLLQTDERAKFICSSYRWYVDGVPKGMNLVLEKFGKKELLQTCFVCTPSVLMRRLTFEEVGGFRKIGAEDFDFWIRALSSTGSYALGDNKSHVLITSTSDSVSSNKLRSAKWYFNVLSLNEKRIAVKVVFFAIFLFNVFMRRILKVKTRPYVIRFSF